MAPPIPNCEPTSIVAGDTVAFTKVLAAYSIADGWLLTYRLVGPLGVGAVPVVDKTITPVPVINGAWQVTFAPTDTAAVVTDGTYRLVGNVALAGEKHTIYDAIVIVQANPLTATPTNLLLHAERALAIIEAAVEGRLTSDMEHFQIDGKLVGKIEMRQLMRLRARYRHEVWRLRNPGVANARRLVRFGGQ